MAIPVWIDRRIDRSRRVSIATGPTTTLGVLRVLAATADCDARPFERVVYIGPLEDAVRVAAIAEANRVHAPSSLLRRVETDWSRLTTPRAVAERIADDAGPRFANPESIPHDLLDKGDLPSMRGADVLTLLLLGCDLRWRVDPREAGQLLIEPLGDRSQWAANDTPPDLTPREGNDNANRRYTLRVRDQPAGAVLRQVANAVGKSLDSSEVEEDAMSRRVSFAVEDATLDELLAAIGEAAELAITATDDRISIRPGDR